MKIKIFLLFSHWLLCLFFIIFGLQICLAQTLPTDSIKSFTLNSEILGEQQKTFVYLPKDYDKNAKKYPVVYILDAEFNFSFTADAVKILSAWTQRIPDCIVIGITSNNRERDLTTAPDKNWQPPQPIPAAGGANKFLGFVQKELIPFVEKNYRTEPLRIIIGHSLGGLFALHTLTAAPNLFRFYILLDASIWWNDGAVAKSAMNYLNNNPNFQGRIIWIRDKIPHEVWFPINTEWLAFLQNKKPPKLGFSFLELENETHSSLVFPGTYLGLRDLFSDYGYKFEENTDFKSVQTHFAKLTGEYGYLISISEPTYNNLSGQLIHQKKYKEAVSTCEGWIKDYPNSSEAYETLGMAYLESGSKDLANNYLKKAIELNPGNEKAKQMLKNVNKK